MDDIDDTFGDPSIARYQLALIDARIKDPLDVIASLTASAPSIKIAIMVESATADLVRSAFANGVTGVLDRTVSFATLACQLELLALGGCVVPAGFVETLAKPQPPVLSDVTAAAVQRLSVREREIVQCIATGMSNKVIARQLQLSEPTVKVHVGAVLRKLNLTNRTKVAVWAAYIGAALMPAVPLVHTHFGTVPSAAARSPLRVPR
ncbi:LuxR C-terminal-related transcriptional regulator [Sphingomonas oryzagri]|uniref:Response regulator transcription factor n=1 Tax=Sphingomonas oryzagri TaxID=3042314 RepID=A0ABT6N1P4_9SPHN|nr:response regulator transcription factor [Sphingomonas oryzagri]MDH7639203.1 response regulator transcription factor [Sphingomonas oryzagri]